MGDGDGAGRGSAPPFVVLEGITKRFPGVVANDDVSLQLRPGEVHALIGENGEGKTTIVKLITRLYDPIEGQVLLDGVDLVFSDIVMPGKMDGLGLARHLKAGQVASHLRQILFAAFRPG